jgi:polysaccharide export outer membrane protein
LAGCQQAAFRAGSLPPEFMAAPVTNSQQLDLARLSNSVGGTGRIQSGDMIYVTIVTGIREIDEQSDWKLRVSEQGLADVPLIGPVQVAGLEPPHAGRAIRDLGIQRGIYRNPTVTVQVVQRQSKTVTVMGAVEEPGVHKLPAANSDLVAALAAAGGLREDASTLVEVRLPSSTHPDQGTAALAGYPGPHRTPPPQLHRVDLVQAAADPDASFPLEDGAVVMVGKQPTRFVYVMGLVNESKQVEMPPDSEMRLLDALASAGGRKFQIADEVTVTRQHPRGGPSALIKASVKAAQNDRAENLVLTPGDVVKVEETPATFIVGMAQSFVRFGFSAAIPGF